MFDMHMLNSLGKAEMEKFKTAMASTMKVVLSDMPEGREKAIFQTKIEEAVFFGAKAIAGKEGNFESIKSF